MQITKKLLFLFFSVLAIGAAVFLYVGNTGKSGTPEQEIVVAQENSTSPEFVPYFNAKTQDGAILLEWNSYTERADLSIHEKDGPSTTTTVDGSGVYQFDTGRHGKLYTFTLSYMDDNSDMQDMTLKRMFVKFDELPELMFLNIDTEDGITPICERYDPTLKMNVMNKEYKKATLNHETPLKIRIRGNSCVNRLKDSYKLSFDKKIDLLGLGEEYADTKWNLMGKSHAETYFGLQMGKAVGLEWQPRMRFVNLILNGEWMGVYILCESINAHPKRVALDQDGYLIEYDVHFRKSNSAFFASDLLNQQLRFIFKHPKILSQGDALYTKIVSQFETIDDAIRHDFTKIENLVDLDSFIAWELAHDMMGTQDATGSNMFFYKQNDNSKLKIGPLWDFDSIFMVKPNAHSVFWFTNTTYFPLLMNNQSVKDKYKAKYFAVAPSIEETMKSAMDKLKDIPGLQESFNLDGEVYGTYKSVDAEIDRLMMRLHERIQWLNSNIEKL
ncbi:MAG: CotH kinase family protein [Alphaproteobacteria bacterium]|nr:CotH kinase family protein [Alphaproteobacteria bacterium]